MGELKGISRDESGAIKLSMNMSVHNRFHAQLIDENGNEKMEAFAENIVTDRFWKDNIATTFIAIGTGVGELSPTRTELFAMLGSAMPIVIISMDEVYPTSTVITQVTYPANTTYTGDITEVGFWNNGLLTHALFNDSQGKPLPIPKLDTDVLIVTATTYITITPGNNYMKQVVAAKHQAVINAIFTTGQGYMGASGRWHTHLSAYPAFVKYMYKTEKLNSLSQGNRSGVYQTIQNNAVPIPRERYFPIARILAEQDNIGFANAINVFQVSSSNDGASLFTIFLPNEEVIEPYMLRPSNKPIEVGRGDGVTKKFVCPIPTFTPNTDEVRVGGVLQVRDVDYTLDPDGNSMGHMSAPVASLKLADVRGPATALTSLTNSGRPVFMPSDNAYTHFPRGREVFPYRVGTDEEGGLVFELEQPERVNTIVIGTPSVNGVNLVNLRFESSQDGVVWNTEHNYGNWYTSAYTPFPKVTLQNTIIAKYFRLVVSGSSGGNQGEFPLISNSASGSESWFGYVDPDGITFADHAIPAENALITFNAMVDRPWKDENTVIDHSWKIRIG